MSGGTKHDDGKSAMHLIPPGWLLGVGDVFAYGAERYGVDNFREGIEVRRLLGAVLRHVLEALDGEESDWESGLHHLFHAGAGVAMAWWMMEYDPSMDDRRS